VQGNISEEGKMTVHAIPVTHLGKKTFFFFLPFFLFFAFFFFLQTNNLPTILLDAGMLEDV